MSRRVTRSARRLGEPRRRGALTPRELQLLSERLARLLELDLAPRVAALAEELIRRGGFVRPSG